MGLGVYMPFKAPRPSLGASATRLAKFGNLVKYRLKHTAGMAKTFTKAYIAGGIAEELGFGIGGENLALTF